MIKCIHCIWCCSRNQSTTRVFLPPLSSLKGWMLKAERQKIGILGFLIMRNIYQNHFIEETFRWYPALIGLNVPQSFVTLDWLPIANKLNTLLNFYNFYGSEEHWPLFAGWAKNHSSEDLLWIYFKQRRRRNFTCSLSYFLLAKLWLWLCRLLFNIYAFFDLLHAKTQNSKFEKGITLNVHYYIDEHDFNL